MESSFNLDPNQIQPFLADVLLGEGLFVAPGAALGSVALPTANPAVLLGAVVRRTPAGQIADVAYGGIARMKAGAAVARGARVTSDNQGRAITATPNAAGATYISQGGVALEDCANANEFIAVMLNCAPLIIT